MDSSVSGLQIRVRRGLSLVDFVGCLGAVAAGVWIASEYFDVNVHRVAYTALEETELLEKIPAEIRPTNPACPNGDCSQLNLTPEERSKLLRAELINLRQEVAHMARSPQGDPSSSEHPDDARRQASVKYWLALRQVVSEVASLQREAEKTLSTNNAAMVLNLRLRAFRYGDRAINAIPTDNVDSEAVETGSRIAQWFERGSIMYQQANELWVGRLSGQTAATADQVWASQQQQHLKEAEFLRDKTAATGSLLALRYASDFPGLEI